MFLLKLYYFFLCKLSITSILLFWDNALKLMQMTEILLISNFFVKFYNCREADLPSLFLSPPSFFFLFLFSFLPLSPFPSFLFLFLSLLILSLLPFSIPPLLSSPLPSPPPPPPLSFPYFFLSLAFFPFFLPFFSFSFPSFSLRSFPSSSFSFFSPSPSFYLPPFLPLPLLFFSLLPLSLSFNTW